MAKEKAVKKTAQTIRQLEILGKYHEIDETNKVIHVKLHYEKATDIILSDMGDKEHPMFGRDIIERVSDILNTFPKDYKIDLDLKIDDYEGYDPSLLLHALSDNFELEHYRTQKQTKKTWLLVMILLFIGVGLLLLLTVLKETNVIGESLGDLVFDYFIDTAACVFMWEAVSQLFIYPAEFVVTNAKVFSLFSGVKFLDKKGNIVAEANKNSVFSELVADSGKKKIGNVFLITTGSVHLILGFVAIANFLVEMRKIKFDQSQIVAYITIMLIVAAVEVIYGIGSINRFRENGPFKNLIFALSIVLMILYIGYAITTGINAANGLHISASIIVSLSVGLLATILNFVGCIFTKPRKEKK